MANKRFTGSLNLSALTHVKTSMKGKNGNLVKGVFIPFEQNFIILGEKGGAYLNIAGQVSDEMDKFENNGFISHSLPSEIYKSYPKGEAPQLPILGNIKFWGVKSTEVNNETNEIDNSFPIDNEDDNEDDLPF